MKRFLRLTVLSALMLTGNAAFAQDECTKIAATGHPAYPVIAYTDGDNIVGAAPTLFIVKADSPITSLGDLIAKAKSDSKMSYGSAGNGTTMHIAAEQLNASAGTTRSRRSSAISAMHRA